MKRTNVLVFLILAGLLSKISSGSKQFILLTWDNYVDILFQSISCSNIVAYIIIIYFRKLKANDQEKFKRTDSSQHLQYARHPNLAQVRLQRSNTRTGSGIKSAPPLTHPKPLSDIGHSLVDLRYPNSSSSSSLPFITSSHPEGSFEKLLSGKSKVQPEDSSPGSPRTNPTSTSNPQKSKSLQPPNLAMYKSLLSNKGKPGAFRGFKDSHGTLVLGSTVNNTFTRKNKDFVKSNFLSRNKKDSTEQFPIYTSSLPTMTMP